MLKYILIAIGVALVVWGIVKRQALAQFWLATKKFMREVKVEMQKVTWPTWNEVRSSTVVVLVAVVILTVIVASWDWVLSWILKVILPRGGA